MALNNVPLSGQTLNDTRNPIRNNFNTIDTAFSVDHVPYAAAGQGQHNKVTFPTQLATPIFGGLIGLWAENYPTTGQVELWNSINQQGGVNQYPWTASVLSNTAINAATNGWSFLPSGILIKWGVSNTAGPANIDTICGGPAYTRVYNAQATLFNNSPGSWFITFTQAPNPLITVNGLGVGVQYYFFIIGV